MTVYFVRCQTRFPFTACANKKLADRMVRERNGEYKHLYFYVEKGEIELSPSKEVEK